MQELARTDQLTGVPNRRAFEEMLQDVTRAWSRELRGTDVLARYGGEEFAVVLRECTLKDAAAVLDKLRRATPAEQTVSLGIAQWDGVENRQALVQRVDEALYTAKSSGRNRLHCAA